jgi:bacteriorhodopsin
MNFDTRNTSLHRLPTRAIDKLRPQEIHEPIKLSHSTIGSAWFWAGVVIVGIVCGLAVALLIRGAAQ